MKLASSLCTNSEDCEVSPAEVESIQVSKVLEELSAAFTLLDIMNEKITAAYVSMAISFLSRE